MVKAMTVAVAAVLVSAPAWADEPKVEIGGNVGWTFSDGVSGQNFVAGNGQVYNRLDPKDSFSWSLTLGYNFTPHWGLEFIYDDQQSTLQAGGTTTTDISDFKIKNYHGAFVYSMGDETAAVRPYLLFGAGATSYPGINYIGIGGVPQQTSGNTQFSGTFGLGVKIYPNNGKAGLRLQGRWTPTYIKSDATGVWCDPYWGCYTVGNAQYSNQFEFSGGVTLRF